jgi:hypothetical protein
VADSDSRRYWFETDFVVNRISKALLAAGIALSFAHSHDRARTESAQAPYQLHDRGEHRCDANRAEQHFRPHFEEPALTTPQITFGLKPLFATRRAFPSETAFGFAGISDGH